MEKRSPDKEKLKAAGFFFGSVFGTQTIETKGRISYKIQKLAKKSTGCSFCNKSNLVKQNGYIGEVFFNTETDKFEWRKTPEITQDYMVLVVKNLFPIIDPNTSDIRSLSLVVIESREHLTSFHLLSQNSIKACLIAYTSLMKEYFDEYMCYILYKNQGKAANSSMDHVHSQLIFLDQVPNRLIENGNEIFRKNDCGLCKYNNIIDKKYEFILKEYKYFIEYCPKYIYPYTIRILAKRHVPHLLALNEEELSELSKIIKIATNRIIGNFGELDYNILYHQSPKIFEDRWHLFIEIIPRGLNEPAGFEMITGIRVTENPEYAAEQLKNIKTRCVMCGEYYFDEMGLCPYCGYLKLHLTEEDF